MKIKVLIADDQAILVEGLMTLLSLDDDFEVCGQASDGVEVLKFLETDKAVDVVLMDIQMPNMSGVECTKRIRKLHPNVKVLVLTTFDDDDYIIEALNHGASGYILKDLTSERLTSAIKNVYHGNMVMHQKVTEKLMKAMASKSGNQEEYHIRDLNGHILLEREEDVLWLLAKGYRNNEIADRLYLSEGTVKNYISILYDKFGIKGRTKLMSYALDHGILNYRKEKASGD